MILAEQYKKWNKSLMSVHRTDKSLDQWLWDNKVKFRAFQVRYYRKVYYIEDPVINTMFLLKFSHKTRKV